MGRVLATAVCVAALVAGAGLARSSADGPAAMATYRALTPSQSSALELTFTPLSPGALTRVTTGPLAAVEAATADALPHAPATGPATVQVRLGDAESSEDQRIGAAPTPAYLVQFEGLSIETVGGPVANRPPPVNHEVWVFVDARTGRALWSETYR